MAWARFDDRYPTHPKMLAAGLEATGLDARAICHSAAHETDGFIADAMLGVLAFGVKSPAKIAQRLVEVGRWSRDDAKKGYWIHDFLVYNQSREEAEKKREAERQRKASGRKNQGRDAAGRVTSASRPGGSAVTSGRNPDHGGADSESLPPVRPPPTGPDPTRPISPSVPLEATNGADHVGNCEMESQNQELPPALLDRLSGLWPGRDRMRAESADVLTRCLAVADASIIDESIGIMLTVDDKPRSPKYLLATVRNRLVTMGAYDSSDPALEPLGAA